MKFFREYIKVFIGQLTMTDTYRQILGKSLRFSIGFFLVSLLLFSFYEALVFRLDVFPTIVGLIRPQVETAVSALPESTTVVFSDNVLSLRDIPVPFSIPLSKEGQDFFGTQDLLRFGSDKSTDALLSLSPESMILSLPSQDLRQTFVYKDGKLPSFSLTKAQLLKETTELFADVPTIATVLMVMLIPATWVGLMLSSGMLAILFSFATQLVAQLLGITLSFRKHVQLSLHIMIVALLIEEIGRRVANAFSYPLLSISYLAIALLVLFSLRAMKYNTPVK